LTVDFGAKWQDLPVEITPMPTVDDEYYEPKNLRHFYRPLETVKFFAYCSGAGEGCDYTRGCNTAMYALKAQTREEADEEIYRLWQSESDGGFTYFFLIDAAGLTVIDEKPLEARLKREQAEAKAQAMLDELREDEERDRAEYERLKSKFEGQNHRS
jgi:hypothetical protein